MKTPTRIIAYLRNRPAAEGKQMGCDVTYADYASTKGMELEDLMAEGRIIAGDTVKVRAMADFGPPTTAARIKRQIEAKGAKVVVDPKPGGRRLKGRRPTVDFEDIGEFDHACSIWYSPAEPDHALRRIGIIAGGVVDENWVKYRCGRRDGSQQLEKRAKALKRYVG